MNFLLLEMELKEIKVYIILLIVYSILFTSCICNKEYELPSKIVNLKSNEINTLTSNSFYFISAKSSHNISKFEFLQGKEIRFNDNGKLICDNKEIGSWNVERKVFINQFKTSYIIQIFSPYNIKLETMYKDCENDKLIHESIAIGANNNEVEYSNEFFD